MKNILINLLLKGYTKTKKYTIKDIEQYCYILQGLFQNKYGMICCNKNYFWHYENNNNRFQLIQDLKNYQKDIRKGTKYTILNRFENGDAYGIAKNNK